MSEITIGIPPIVTQIIESLGSKSTDVYNILTESITRIWGIISYDKNAVWLILSMIIFWPLWVYFAVAVTTASGWIFWLLASVLLGVLQLIYVSYQFVMISCDVMVLTLLKSYHVIVRSRFIQCIFFFSKRIRNSRIRTSRRRKWHKAQESCTDYSDFLNIQIHEPTKNETDSDPVDAAIPPSPKRKVGYKQKRSQSFANLKTLYEEQHQQQESSPTALSPTRGGSRPPLQRVGSFDRQKALQDMVVQNAENEIDPRVKSDLGDMTAELLTSTVRRLKEARVGFSSASGDGDNTTSKQQEDSHLKYLLSGVVKRNHLTIEDSLVRNARSVANSGQHEFTSQSRKVIATYYDEVTKSLDCLSETEPPSGQEPLVELSDRMTLVRKMKQNMGRTALMLSGGGAQAMYHLGTVRGLIDSNLYEDIKVISGTSGGSITAACCAMYTPKELYETICIPTVSTDYKKTGEMKKDNIRWFPPVMDMVAYWLKHRLLVDSKYFFRTCEFYYGSTTFAEAFERTGKHVCITVSASRAGAGGTAQRLLLNHISTPHVTLASSVAASCALPGVMKPAKLQTKNSLGDLEPFEVDGVEWIDGSVQADLPFQRISTLFNVSNYIVCQTNFHVVPFLNKDHHPSTQSLYWRIFQTIEWDIRSRALKLSRLGLFPRIFGQDMSKVFKQKYHGNLTLVPRFTAAQTFGLKALVNPSVKEMEGYLKYGQLAVWPYIGVIREMLRLETALDECLEKLKTQCHALSPESDMTDTDDVDSLASGHSSFGRIGMDIPSVRNRVVRFGYNKQDSKEVDNIRRRLSKSEEENRELRNQLNELKTMLAKLGSNEKLLLDDDEEKRPENEKEQINIDLSEGGVWNLVQQLNFSHKEHAK